MAKFILSGFGDETSDQLSRQMEVFEGHGIKFIEMRKVDGKVISDCTLEEVKEIRNRLDDKGFNISAVGSPIGKIGLVEDFKAHLDLFKHTVEIAQILKTNYIRMFSFFIPQGEEPGKFRNEVIDRWGQFVEAAKGSGVVLLHENEGGIYGDNAERCLDLMKTLNSSSVKAIFDPANFVQCDVETYPHAYFMLKDYIAYMHIKDALFDGHGVMPAGYGDGKIPEILADLYNSGFEGFLSLEPHLGRYRTAEDFKVIEPNLDLSQYTENSTRRFAMASYAIKKVLAGIEK